MTRLSSTPFPAFLALLASWLMPLAAHAHEGHGLPDGSHWHGTDTLGFLFVVALSAAALWLGGRR